MATHRAVAAGLLPVLVTVLAACSGGAPSGPTPPSAAPGPATSSPVSDEDAVRQALRAYNTALLGRDFERACAAITSDAGQKLINAAQGAGLPAGSCEQAMGSIYADGRTAQLLDEATRTEEISDVDVHGDKAVVTYTGTAGGQHVSGLTLDAERIDGIWRFGSPR